MDGDWISAARAYEIVSGAVPFRAASAICSRANDGLIASRAKKFAWGDKSFDDAEVPSSFWWARGELALKQNWASGDFETWIDQKIHCRAYGVLFCREDIEEMVPDRKRLAPQLERSEAGNYASAMRCRNELKAALRCDDKEAEGVILRACRAGLVVGNCASISWRVTDRYGATEYEDTNVAVPDWFWEHCLQSPETVLNWSSGRFAGKGFVDGDEYKAKLTGVAFQVTDIVELEDLGRKTRPADRVLEAAEDKRLMASSGRRRSDQWRPWIAELVAHIHEHGFPDGVGSQGQEELIKAVADALAQREQDTLARSTVQPVIQAVLDRLRAAEK